MTGTKGSKPQVGEVFHFLAAGFTRPTLRRGVLLHEVSRRGDQDVITDQLIQAGTDRNGACWLDLLHDPAGQVAKFGREVIAPGPTPEGMSRTVPGSAEHDTAARRAREDAWKIKDPVKRGATLRELHKRFGPPPPTSQTLTTYGRGQ